MARFLDRFFKKPLTDEERRQVTYLVRALIMMVISIIVVGTLVGVIVNTLL